MKNLFKKLFSCLLVVFLAFSVVSCTKKSTTTTTQAKEDISVLDKNLSIYNAHTDSTNDLLFQLSSYTTCEYDDNVLELEYKVTILNVSEDRNANLTFKNPKAYGNDLELQEQVLSSYDYTDKSKNALYQEQSFVVDKKETCKTTFFLVIQDGNKDADIRIDVEVNNITLSIAITNEKPAKFTYVHNPALNPKVLEDAEVDANAVFGFKPNTTGSLSTYTSYDWTIESDVLIYKQNRIDYIEENDGRLKALENELRAQGKSIEEIARACSLLRNQIRLDQYKNDPEGLEKLKERNMTKYGHEDGPTPDESYTKYGSWEMVLEKAYTTNRGMDACCGVYDLYFYLYNELPY